MNGGDMSGFKALMEGFGTLFRTRACGPLVGRTLLCANALDGRTH